MRRPRAGRFRGGVDHSRQPELEKQLFLTFIRGLSQLVAAAVLACFCGQRAAPEGENKREEPEMLNARTLGNSLRMSSWCGTLSFWSRRHHGALFGTVVGLLVFNNTSHSICCHADVCFWCLGREVTRENYP